MRLAEIRNSKPSANVVAALNYLCDLSSETGIPVEAWDLTEVFGPEITNAPRELNKKFFAHAKRLERVAKSTLSPDQIKIIEQASKRFRPGESGQLETTIEDRRTKIRNAQQNIVSWGREIGDLRLRIEALTSSKSDLLRIAQEILDTGFWTLETAEDRLEYEGTDGWCLTFISDEIVLSRPHQDGRDFKLNFGRIKIGLTEDGQIMAKHRDYQNKAAIRAGRGPFFHPYISYDGRICYGTAASVVADLMSKRLYADVFIVTQNLLTTYTPDNPYCSIETFFLEGQDRQTGERAPWLKSLSPEMKQKYGLTEEGQRREVFVTHFLECNDCGYEFDWVSRDGVSTDVYRECPDCGHDNYIPDTTTREVRDT